MTIEKLKTNIRGFDILSDGGLPKNRTTLISGTAGSGKTILAAQFIIMGIEHSGDPGIFVTFEESPEDIRTNMKGFGWAIDSWENENKWLFVDGSPELGEDTVLSGSYDLGALLARIEYAAKKIGARRVVMDSLGAIFNRFNNREMIRHELFRISSALKRMNVTSLMTAERTEEYGDIARYGVEEFVADNVVILRNVLEEEKRRRTIEILKFRGTNHQKGETPFTIIPDEGLVIVPLYYMELKQRAANIRITSGNGGLDKMCGGGFFRDSVLLVSGATGTGKTLMVTEFMAGGALNGDRSLLLAFEESRDQLFRNASGWGYDFEDMEKKGLLKVVCVYPESAGLEDHFIRMREAVEKYQPNRLAIDSLSALERVSTMKLFREFIIGMTSFIKQKEITGLFTSTTPNLLGGSSVTEAHISTITDSIILLRYVEMFGEMHRGLTILKMRGSMHDKAICEFTIDNTGMHIGKPFRNIGGILEGRPTHIPSSEMERIDKLFQE